MHVIGCSLGMVRSTPVVLALCQHRLDQKLHVPVNTHIVTSLLQTSTGQMKQQSSVILAHPTHMFATYITQLCISTPLNPIEKKILQ
jgi:hypothetical protein